MNINSCYLCFLFLDPFFEPVFFLFFFIHVLFLSVVVISSITGFMCPFTGFVITKFSSVTCPQSISWVLISSESLVWLSSLSSQESSSLLSASVSISAKLFTWMDKTTKNQQVIVTYLNQRGSFFSARLQNKTLYKYETFGLLWFTFFRE